MEIIKISAVSYLNTFPFVFGLKTSGELEDIDLQLDIPSVCAEKLKYNAVDIALVPVGAIPELENPVEVAKYCIGAEREVKTVVLVSHKPLGEITEIALDFDSRTSIKLAKLLAEKYWHIQPLWRNLQPGEAETATGLESLVAIGDKTFKLIQEYPYVYDLAGEWIRFTHFPFVFAVWLSTRKLPESFIRKFNLALEYGIQRIHDIPEFFPDKIPPGFDVVRYLRENISYPLDERKRKGMELFLEMIQPYG